METPTKTRTAAAALYYHPEGFDTGRKKLMGRHVAGESFLKAYARYGSPSEMHCLAEKDAYAQDLRRRLQGFGVDKGVRWIPGTRPENLRQVGTLFLPGPGLGEAAWTRRFHGEGAYSLCGLTHTTSSTNAMDSIGDWLLAPVHPWDAVICTSTSVRAMAQQVLANYHEYLCRRMNARVSENPIQLPVIPLGVHGEDFDAPERDAHRRQWRDKLGMADDAVAVLFMGRLSYHAKAHPYPLYVALEQACQATGKEVHLLMAGWFANDALAEQFKTAAAECCPSVKVHFLDGRQPEVRHHIWYAADIFTSLSDNIQETFGITPIEAMAAGLPVVITDWDGYKETVRESVDGFRIPTLLPEAGAGQVLAYRHAAGIDTYDRYIGQVSQCTAVDIPACTRAFQALITDPALRARMGEDARQSVRERFDWRVIIPQYEELWASLAERRRAASELSGLAHPLRSDPFQLFAHYPSRVIRRETKLRLGNGFAMADFDKARKMAMNQLASPLLLGESEQAAILQALQAGCTVAQLAERINAQHVYPALLRTLGWMAKLGAVETDD